MSDFSTKKQYSLGNKGRETIKNTAKVIGDMLGKTLGPAGRNYFLPQGITNDGKTIMGEIRFQDECQDQVALAFHEVARQTDKDAGDGTTTSIVVASKLVEEIISKVPDIDVPLPGSVSVMELARQLEAEKDKALAILKDKVIKVDSQEMLEKVALTSVENKEVAKIIAETIWEAGKDSYPILENGFREKIEKSVINGVRWPLNVAHPSMLNRNKTADYTNCAVLVVNHAFEEYLELAPFMASLLEKKPKIGGLVIVAKSFSVPFIGAISSVVNQMAQMGNQFPILLLSANFHQDMFEDIAAFVGARCVDTHPKTGKKIGDVTYDHTGLVKRIVATEKEATFIGGRGSEDIRPNGEAFISRIGDRVKEIKAQIENEKNEDERRQMERRIAALQGGIATIYVDAKTSAERVYLKLKVEDAMNSCRAALNDGIVQGGGLTLKAIADELGEGSLLYKALLEPYKRVKMNNGGEELDATDVFDSYAVAKASIENPVSIVKVVITLEGIISDVDKGPMEDFIERLRS